MRLLSCLGVLAAAATAIACSVDLPSEGCAGVGYFALSVNVQDQFGSPQAFGAKVTVTDGSYAETDTASEDPFTIYAAAQRGGRTYNVRVSKPYYVDVGAAGVRTSGNSCRGGTTNVPITLSLASNAPAIRSLRLVPHHILLDRAPYTTTFAFRPYVDANRGVSQVVSWSIHGDTGSVGFDKLSGTLTYRCRPKSGYLMLVARSVIDSTLVDSADVAVQGHPGDTNDPPC